MRFPGFEGEWEEKKLGEICKFVRGPFGSALKKEFFIDDGYAVYEQSHAIHNNFHSFRYYISEEKFNSLRRFSVEPKDIIMSCSGTMGKFAIIPKKSKKGIINQALLKLTPQENFYHKFIKLALELPQIQNKILSQSAGGAIKNVVGIPQLKEIELYIPKPIEQNKISTFFSLLDQRIETQSKIIEELKLLKSTLSKRLLLNGAWEQFQIADIASIGRGRVISSVEISKQRNPEYPVYSSQTSNNGIMGYLDSYDFEGKYVTWTTDGANAGTVFYRNGKFNCTNVCGTLKINQNHNPYFVALCLNLIAKKYVSTNLANPKLMNNVMASVKLSLPTLQEQNRVAKLFVILTNKIHCENSILEALHKEKNYFLQQMFI
ncbi:restriction endonuclease subunit S [Odoribacter sp. OttesenSCG-928-J03]|nr:restriction endonuclease subunit S [Odoribacter sp. OttesenSCG-928-J03]